jgi:DNA-binding FadR family transcriptional regulator
VREQIKLQAEFGPVLWLGMTDAGLRDRTAEATRSIADAIADRDGEAARAQVTTLIRSIAEWLLAARARLEKGGPLDG